MIESLYIFLLNQLSKHRQKKTPVTETGTHGLLEVESFSDYIKDIVMKPKQKFWMGGVLYLVKSTREDGKIILKAVGAKSGNNIVRGKVNPTHQGEK